MCIGVPMRIVSVSDGMAVAERRGVRERINVLLVGEPAVGAWVLAFQGSAVRAMTEEEAQQTEAALQALEAALAGESRMESFFADLVDREPELPAHLKAAGPMIMPDAANALAPHPLVEQLVSRHGATRLDAAAADAFCKAAGVRLLVFTEDPVRYRETLDLAVIVPELMRAFPGRFTTGVLLPDDARAMAARFGFRRWPALVVLRDGGYVGAIDGLRNWDEYVTAIAQLLEAPVTRAPGIGIAVAAAPDPDLRNTQA